MNSAYRYGLLAGLLFLGGSWSCEAEVPQARIDALYNRLNSTCGNSFFGINQDFEHQFPEAEQSDVLAEVIERAAARPKDALILASAIYFLENFRRPDGTEPWSQRLESALLGQTHHAEPSVRMALASLYIHKKDRKLALGFLEDEDDQVRERVISEINRDEWPDALTIDRQYIERTIPEGTHHTSVVRAKQYTKPIDNERAGKICEMSQQPDVQAHYLSYIAQHKDDPDYEVSVDTAQRFYDSNQANINYQKAVEQEKKRADFLHKAVSWDQQETHPLQTSFTEQVDHLFWLFDTEDSSTSQYACRYFKLFTSPSAQPHLLTAMMKRAVQAPVNKNVLLNVLVAAEHQHNSSMQVGARTDELDTLVWSQRNHPERNVRNYIIRYIDGWRSDGWRDEVLSFLNDPDSVVRENCAYTISNTWPDYKAIFDQYIESHRSDEDCKSTVYVMEAVIKDREKMAAAKAKADKGSQEGVRRK